MKWIEAQNGNLYRLGAIDAFVRGDKEIMFFIGDDAICFCKFKSDKQAEYAYCELQKFLINSEPILHALSNEVSNSWTKLYNISSLELNLSPRVCNALKRGGINTVYELITTSDFDLEKIRNLGETGREEIRQKLKLFFENATKRMSLPEPYKGE